MELFHLEIVTLNNYDKNLFSVLNDTKYIIHIELIYKHYFAKIDYKIWTTTKLINYNYIFALNLD